MKVVSVLFSGEPHFWLDQFQTRPAFRYSFISSDWISSVESIFNYFIYLLLFLFFIFFLSWGGIYAFYYSLSCFTLRKKLTDKNYDKTHCSASQKCYFPNDAGIKSQMHPCCIQLQSTIKTKCSCNEQTAWKKDNKWKESFFLGNLLYFVLLDMIILTFKIMLLDHFHHF